LPVCPAPPGGVGGPNRLNELFKAAEQLVKKALQNPKCAALFKDPSACVAELSKIGFANLGPLNFTSTNGGPPQLVSGDELAGAPTDNPSQIQLNTSVNWLNPNQTSAFLNGQPWTYQGINQLEAYLSITSNVTASQYMGFTILHELEHFSNLGENPDSFKSMTTLWQDCLAPQ
jgi:hypothetical protein